MVKGARPAGTTRATNHARAGPSGKAKKRWRPSGYSRHSDSLYSGAPWSGSVPIAVRGGNDAAAPPPTDRHPISTTRSGYRRTPPRTPGRARHGGPAKGSRGRGQEQERSWRHLAARVRLHERHRLHPVTHVDGTHGPPQRREETAVSLTRGAPQPPSLRRGARQQRLAQERLNLRQPQRDQGRRLALQVLGQRLPIRRLQVAPRRLHHRTPVSP